MMVAGGPSEHAIDACYLDKTRRQAQPDCMGIAIQDDEDSQPKPNQKVKQ